MYPCDHCSDLSRKRKVYHASRCPRPVLDIRPLSIPALMNMVDDYVRDTWGRLSDVAKQPASLPPHLFGRMK